MNLGAVAGSGRSELNCSVLQGRTRRVVERRGVDFQCVRAVLQRDGRVVQGMVGHLVAADELTGLAAQKQPGTVEWGGEQRADRLVRAIGEVSCAGGVLNARTSCVSQLPMIVLAPSSPYRAASWLVVWHNMVHQMFLLRTTEIACSKLGMRKLPKSSRNMRTGTGSEPLGMASASLPSEMSAWVRKRLVSGSSERSMSLRVTKSAVGSWPCGRKSTLGAMRVQGASRYRS